MSITDSTTSLDTAWVEPMNYQGRSIIGVTALSETRTVKLPIGRAIVVSARAAIDGARTFFANLILSIFLI